MFRSDSQRRAMFANMFSGSPRATMLVKNKFSNVEDVKEGLNGFVCSKCGDVFEDEKSYSGHACEEVVESTGSFSSETAGGVASSGGGVSYTEEIVIEDEEDEMEDDSLLFE